MKRKLLFLPLILLLGLCILLFRGLQQDPTQIVSALIDKPVPEFYLPALENKKQILSNHHLPKSLHLLNVWGSWCGYCRAEMPFIIELAKEIPIVGLNYRDNTQSALAFLQKYGNPFILNLEDSKGQLAMDLGADGAPETYLVDENGIIRQHHAGSIDQAIWQQEFLPVIKKLKGQ